MKFMEATLQCLGFLRWGQSCREEAERLVSPRRTLLCNSAGEQVSPLRDDWGVEARLGRQDCKRVQFDQL